jgi:hypothetical protein
MRGSPGIPLLRRVFVLCTPPLCLLRLSHYACLEERRGDTRCGPVLGWAPSFVMLMFLQPRSPGRNRIPLSRDVVAVVETERGDTAQTKTKERHVFAGRFL